MTSLLNRKAIREAALRIASPRGFSRVSKSFLDRVEEHTRAIVEADIHRHPSMGKTLR